MCHASWKGAVAAGGGTLDGSEDGTLDAVALAEGGGVSVALGGVSVALGGVSVALGGGESSIVRRDSPPQALATREPMSMVEHVTRRHRFPKPRSPRYTTFVL